MAAPDTLLIPHEDFEYGRFTHVGLFGGGQFLGYLTYAAPKRYHPEETAPDGQTVWQEHINCYAVLHRFDAAGRHLDSSVERVTGTPDGEAADWAKLEEMIARLGHVELGDIRVATFRTEVAGVVHGLIYECERSEEDGEENDWVMLEPNDIMFHPPWDSGEYST